MDDAEGQSLSCQTCGAKVNSPEELETHNKDAHGGGAEGGGDSGGGDAGGATEGSSESK